MLRKQGVSVEWQPRRWGRLGGGDYLWQPQRKRETKVFSTGVASGLVRRLMAAERARILGRRAIDLGRYTLEKRTQRWRESRSHLNY